MSTLTATPLPAVKARQPWYSSCVDLSPLLTPGDIVDDDFASWAADKLRPVLHTETTLQVEGGGYMTLDFRSTYPTFQRTAGHHWQYMGRRPRGSVLVQGRF
jgi:hypothetical protein